MNLLLAAAATLTVAIAGPVAAQTYYGQGHGQSSYEQGSYGHGYQGHSSDRRNNSGSRHYSSGYDYQGQRDVPGDFRCDAYWDRGRTDCDAAWRDQRRYSSQGHRGSSHRSYGHRRYNSGHGGGYYGHQGGTTYQGAYGRPDVVYPGGGQVYGGGGRNPHRIDWCRATYRSYNPSTGYYLAYSGHWVFCG